MQHHISRISIRRFSKLIEKNLSKWIKIWFRIRKTYGRTHQWREIERLLHTETEFWEIKINWTDFIFLVISTPTRTEKDICFFFT
jgi:hypothetical protein